MFVLTLGKKSLRRLGAAAVCGIALAGAVLAVSGFIHAGDSALEANAPASQSGAAAIPEKITGSEDIAAFFKGFGLEVDLTTATVDKVKVPKKWDESFSAFNTVVKESGFDLADSKGKTVEKWLVECPARSDGENTCQCVLLVYKEKPVGAYLLSQRCHPRAPDQRAGGPDRRGLRGRRGRGLGGWRTSGSQRTPGGQHGPAGQRRRDCGVRSEPGGSGAGGMNRTPPREAGEGRKNFSKTGLTTPVPYAIIYKHSARGQTK